MLRTLLQKLRRMTRESEAVDPSRFGDPVAEQTGWTPARRGGASFRTHRLVRLGYHRMEFRASTGARVFYLLFLVAGCGVVIGVSIYRLSTGSFSFTMETVMPLVIGLVFAIAGGCLLHFGTVPVVFDKSYGFFWKGKKSPAEVFDRSRLKVFTELAHIHALQLLSEYCRSGKHSYYSYELNLVLENGERINFIDHGNRTRLQEDAGTLAEFLEKPLWDATSPP